jgi:hypothetical protein
MKCKGCKKEILDNEEYGQLTVVPEECEEGYRKFGCAPVLLYCYRCSREMRRFIFEKNNKKQEETFCEWFGSMQCQTSDGRIVNVADELNRLENGK